MNEEQVSSSTEGTPSAPATTTSETPAAKPSLFDSMDRIGREILAKQPVHGEDGRFQPKVVADKAPAANEVPGGPQTAQTPDPQPVVIEAPQSLPADVKGEWAKLPPSVQKYWADRESEIHKRFTTDGERLKALSSYEEVLSPYQERLKQVGAPPVEYIRRLAEADKLLSTDPRAGIAEVARMYGINLGQLQQHPGAQPDPNRALARELTQLRSQLDTLTKGAEADKLKAAEDQIKAARKDMPHYDAVEHLMVKLFEPGMDLKDLYNMAVNAHSETREKVAAEVKKAADEKAAEEAKEKAKKDAKLATQATRPGSTPTAPLKGKNMWDTMDRVGREIQARS